MSLRAEYQRDYKRRKRRSKAVRDREYALAKSRHALKMRSDPAYAKAWREKQREKSRARTGTEANKEYQRDYKRRRRLGQGKPVRDPATWGKKARSRRVANPMSLSERGRLGAAARWAKHPPQPREKKIRSAAHRKADALGIEWTPDLARALRLAHPNSIVARKLGAGFNNALRADCDNGSRSRGGLSVAGRLTT